MRFRSKRTGTTFGLRLTRAGVLYVSLTLFLGFAAVNTGNNLLYLVVSVLLGFMSLSGWLGQNNLRRLSAHLVPPREIYADRPTLCQLEIKNPKRFWHSFLIDITLGPISAFVPVLPRRGEQTLYPEVRFPHRGIHRLGSLTIASIFPVNFFVRHREAPSDQQVLVYPRPSPVYQTTGIDLKGAAATHPQPSPGAEGDFLSVRPYAGESLRQVHWRLSARQQELLVRQHSGTGAKPLEIDVEQLPGPGLEKKLQQACWLVLQCDKGQRPVGLTLGDRTITPGTGGAHKHRLLEALARHET